MNEEWLLSGNNTQESVALTRPLMASAMENVLSDAILWFLGQLTEDIPGFDLKLPPVVVVQGWVYLNLNFSIKNAMLNPFDPASVGVPDSFVAQHPGLITPPVKISLPNLIRFLQRFRKFYNWAVKFYGEQLPAYDEEARDVYWKLREHPEDMDLVWKVFESPFKDHGTEASHAHETVSIIIVVLDGLVRRYVPELLGLFVGYATTTSLIGQRIWKLRTTALTCGPEVCGLLRRGETDPRVYADIPAAAPLMEGLQAFLKDYGHRGFRYELDFSTERLADYPQQLLLSIAGQLDEQVPPTERAASSRVAAERALQAMPAVKRELWRRVLKWSQQLIAYRENSKSYLSLHQATFGVATRTLSLHYYPQDPPEMIQFYNFGEFNRLTTGRGREQVAREVLDRRREEYELYQNQPPPPELVWYEPQSRHWRPALDTIAPEETGFTPTRFRGIPASAGTAPAEGLAMVTNDPLEAGRRLLEIREPVILVTRLTDPAWSSLFARLGGVVTELGGVISHAAIVARENGLPAVVGVAEVTRHIRNGQRLRIDGATGQVDVLD